MSTLTPDMIREADELIKSLAPPSAPRDTFRMQMESGLNVIKSDNLPRNSVMVSRQIFDAIYTSSEEFKQES